MFSRLALARGQIALGGLALRAGLDVGMVEGPPFALGARPGPEFDEILERARGGLIDYRLDAPKHEFLSYVVQARGHLLHGTASPNLDEVRPTVAGPQAGGGLGRHLAALLREPRPRPGRLAVDRLLSDPPRIGTSSLLLLLH